MPLTGPTRPAGFAGDWYAADPTRLREQLEGYMNAAADAPGGRPIALISPHAGYRFSGATAAYGYRALRGKSYRTIFLLGPSHRAFVRGVAVATEAYFETPLGRIPVDRAAADALRASPRFQGDARAHSREHSLEMQLPMLQVALGDTFAIVPMLVGDLSRTDVEPTAEALRAVIGPEDLLVASSDFTHYGRSFDFTPFTEDVPANLERLANEAWTAIEARDASALLDHKQKTGDTICGALPVALLLATVPRQSSAHRLRFDTSGQLSGDYSTSVSYLSVSFTGAAWRGRSPHGALPAACTPLPPRVQLGDAARRTAHEIARRSLEQWVREKVRFDPDPASMPIDPELEAPLGVFVTLEEHEQLRGCIGNIQPRGPLYQAIAGRAVDASQDPRFDPVLPEELADITIEISVLTEPEQIAGPSDIVLGRDGVILRKAGRSAVFLPQVAPEQGWNVEQMLSHLARKAGLGSNEWREGATFEAFQAVVF